MATSQTDSSDETDSEEKIFEISVEQVTHETVTVQAESREEAFEALREPQDREVQTALVRKDFSSLIERRPTDGRHAPELEDYDDPDIDIDLTADE
ncbi:MULTISPECIES: hypothetical protein [Halorussus]|uniref:hypothetical protein n=1 Tax=Halorussus TaxID=1070314 RepID=UPI00209CA286|nr:hypothetical protein [Halorussus vallis]USZ75674.1 hypothetical protein NGM07_19875 [Halorussus vallis]USZ75748.1 hypothetical protein NGM07_00105 [Halorussus vallis]